MVALCLCLEGFMCLLLNEGHYFTTKTRKVGLAAKTPTLQIPPTRQSAKMKIRQILWENLFFLARNFLLPAPSFYWYQSRLVFIFSSVHRSQQVFITKTKRPKVPLKPAVHSRYKRWQIIKSRIIHPTSLWQNL